MARGVLGNDPFKRGAAARPEEPEQPKAPKEHAGEPAASAPARAPKKKAGSKARPAAAARKAKSPSAPKKKAKKAPAAPRPPEPETAPAAVPEAQEVAVSVRPAEPAPHPVPEVAQGPSSPRLRRSAQGESAAAPEPVVAEGRELEVILPSGPEPQPEHEGHPEPYPAESPEPVSEPAAWSPPPQKPPLKERAVSALALGRELVSQAAGSSALSGVFEAATGVIRAIQTGLGTAGAAHLDDYGKDEALTRQLGSLTSFLYDRYWRVTVEGAQHLPPGPAIVVANHSGAVPFDGPVLQTALKRERPDLREARWLVEDQIFHAPFLGTLINRLGAVRACPENAIRLLEEGRPVLVFPEGVQGLSKPWSERYRLMRFGRGGFVKIALKMRVPIVPVAIVGAEESMPLLARLPGKMFGLPFLPLTTPVPLPARWHIRVGEPISVEEHPAEAEAELLLVNRLNERTREAIQGMLEAMLKARRGIFA